MISLIKWKILNLYKNSQKCRYFGQNNCCHRLWKVAQSAISGHTAWWLQFSWNDFNAKEFVASIASFQSNDPVVCFCFRFCKKTSITTREDFIWLQKRDVQTICPGGNFEIKAKKIWRCQKAKTKKKKGHHPHPRRRRRRQRHLVSTDIKIAKDCFCKKIDSDGSMLFESVQLLDTSVTGGQSYKHSTIVI